MRPEPTLRALKLIYFAIANEVFKSMMQLEQIE